MAFIGAKLVSGDADINVFENPLMSSNSQSGYIASIGNADLQDVNSEPYHIFDKNYTDYCTLINMTAGDTYYQLETPDPVFPVDMIFSQNSDGDHMLTGKVMASKTGDNNDFVEIIPAFFWIRSPGARTSKKIESNADYYKYFRYYPLTWGSYCSFAEWEIFGVNK